MIVYCNYTRDKQQYSENRIFILPVRGKAKLVIESNNNILKVGNNKILLL